MQLWKKEKSAADAPVERREGSCALSIVLIALGACALAVVMYCTGRFGYGLQEAEGDRYASALGFILVDASAAALVSACSFMLRKRGWAWKTAGAVAGACSVVLVVISIIGT